MTQLDIVTFGYGHNRSLTGDLEIPEAHRTPDLTVDLRRLFRDPLRNERLRELDGRHPDVIEHVHATPGFSGYIRALYDALVPLRGYDADRLIVAIGCGGGRHRAVVAGADMHQMAVLHRWAGVLINRDINRPLLPLPAPRWIGRTHAGPAYIPEGQ
jgi:UPF0042 nucleotide-binding protein